MPALAHTGMTSRAPAHLQRHTEPFRSAEEAWFWTMAALIARRDGARYTANNGRVARPTASRT